MSGGELSDRASRELHRSLHALAAAVRQLLERMPVKALPGEPVTVEQMRVLRFLSLNPEIRVGEVAEGLGIKPSSTSLALSRLEVKGMVTRETGSGDRRTVRLVVTPAGRALVRQVERTIEAKLEATVARLGAETANGLSQMLRDLVTALMEGEKYFPEICRHCGPGYQDTCAVHRLFTSCPYSGADSAPPWRFRGDASARDESARPD